MRMRKHRPKSSNCCRCLNKKVTSFRVIYNRLGRAYYKFSRRLESEGFQANSGMMGHLNLVQSGLLQTQSLIQEMLTRLK